MSDTQSDKQSDTQSDHLAQIDELQAQAQRDLDAVNDAASLEQFRIKYLGSKGALKQLMSAIKDVPKEQKRDFGQRANALQKEIQQAFEQRKAAVGGAAPQASSRKPQIDVTEPGLPPQLGREAHHYADRG